MRYTRLGRAGPAVSRMGLGSLALAGAYGHADRHEAAGLIRRALDAGVTLVDTADFYAAGQVERVVGRAVAGRAHEVVVCTRGGARVLGRTIDFDGRPEYLERACESSLKRLDVESVGVYFLHCQDPRVPIEESMGALSALVAAGKIRHIGLSGATAAQLRRAHAAHPVTALAVEFSLWVRRANTALLAEAERLGVGVLAARPLGRGFLTGRIGSAAVLGPHDWRHGDTRFLPERDVPALRRLEAAAAELDLGAGRLALGWLLAQDERVVPVPSTRDQVHLEMNLAATTVALGRETRDELTGIFPDYSPSLLL
ncbi:aldo/keto reductase [Nonomuraea sp. NPDC059007]|uniref:aldo/keto reductase n=1 Tax=Nonomuraea sp. NPDC059007 TaxID=3346692 RepID=UPI00367A334A